MVVGVCGPHGRSVLRPVETASDVRLGPVPAQPQPTEATRVSDRMSSCRHAMSHDA